jgi:hypothetical protein
LPKWQNAQLKRPATERTTFQIADSLKYAHHRGEINQHSSIFLGFELYTQYFNFLVFSNSAIQQFPAVPLLIYITTKYRQLLVASLLNCNIASPHSSRFCTNRVQTSPKKRVQKIDIDTLFDIWNFPLILPSSLPSAIILPIFQVTSLS